jgi:hypothetical protein
MTAMTIAAAITIAVTPAPTGDRLRRPPPATSLRVP